MPLNPEQVLVKTKINGLKISKYFCTDIKNPFWINAFEITSLPISVIVEYFFISSLHKRILTGNKQRWLRTLWLRAPGAQCILFSYGSKVYDGKESVQS